MIRIKIEQIISEAYEEEVNLVVKEEPTEYVKETGYGRNEREMKREYQVAPVKKTRERTVELLRQEIVDDDNFDLASVISAINKLCTITVSTSAGPGPGR